MLSYNKDTPILLILSNNNDVNTCIIEIIRKAAPKKLYVSSDYIDPKISNSNIEYSDIVASIDWDCNIKTLFHTYSIGYDSAVLQAIIWFFDNEPEGIVLESFYIPSDDFFGFCSQLLEKYRDDVRIGHISGIDYNRRVNKNKDSYYFSLFPGTRGWASWSRVWKNFKNRLKLYPSFKRAKIFDNSIVLKPFKAQWEFRFEQAFYNKEAESWFTLYQFVLISGSYLSVISCRDLTKNYKDTFSFVFIDKLIHPLFIIADTLSDCKYQEFFFSVPAVTVNKPDGYAFIKKKLLSFSHTSFVKDRMKIPRIIHQIYEDPEGPSEFLLSLAETWKEFHPEWEYRFWNRKTINDFLESTCPYFIPFYKSYPFNVQRWDAIRYLILYHIGGLYVDLDYECMQPLDSILMDSTCCMGMEPTVNNIIQNKSIIIGNALMASTPKHPYMKALIEDMKTNFFTDFGNNNATKIMESTGPFMVTRVYKQFKNKRNVTLLSADLVAPFTMNEVLMLQIGKETIGSEIKIEKAFAIHYFFGSWLPQTKKQNFTS